MHAFNRLLGPDEETIWEVEDKTVEISGLRMELQKCWKIWKRSKAKWGMGN